MVVTKREQDQRPAFGLCQWFHYEEDRLLERAVELLAELGCRRLRTGVSWADFHRPRGRAWYRRQFEVLSGAGIELLVSIWHTPPSIAEGGTCSGPPRDLNQYACFIWEVLQEFGDAFDAIEIWNEPNNRIKWNFRRYDPDWSKFAALARLGAEQAKLGGKTTVLGGMIPVDASWLALIDRHGGLEAIDVVAFHAFPGMWWHDHPNWDWSTHWQGWRDKRDTLAAIAGDRPLWVTETGLATWEVHERRPARFAEQAARLAEAAAAPVERVYWYSLIDLDPARPCIEMTEDGRVDENEYHMGLVTHAGRRKPAFQTMREVLRAEPVSVRHL